MAVRGRGAGREGKYGLGAWRDPALHQGVGPWPHIELGPAQRTATLHSAEAGQQTAGH